MTPLLFVLIAVAGGVGAAARFMVDGAVRSVSTSRFPVGTVLINVTGSFALGLLVGFGMSGFLDSGWQAVLGAGFLGGYTTFSTASLETVRLLQQRRRTAAALNSFGTMVLATAAAGLGLLLPLL